MKVVRKGKCEPKSVAVFVRDVDKGHSNVMNGADIPDDTVFTGVILGLSVMGKGLFVKDYHGEFITVIWHPHFESGTKWDRDSVNFPDYKVVEELTAVVK